MNSRLWHCLCIGSALIGASETTITVARAPEGSFDVLAASVALAGTLAVALALAMVFAAALESVARAMRTLESAGLYAPARRLQRVDGLRALLVTAPVAVGLGAVVISCFERFRNRELSALLASTAVVGTTGIALLGSGLLTLVFERARLRLGEGRARWLLWLPALLVWGALLGIEWTARITGISQLDSLLLVPIVCACIAGALAAVLRSSERISMRRSLAILALVAVLLALFAALAPPRPAEKLASHGAWSRLVIPSLRALSDFDGDGHGAYFGGGDCDGWDPDVHPNAVERAGNGIDDNCLGGDGDGAPLSAPTPSGTKLLGPDARPNIVLVTIETLRSDRTSLLGYERATTPRLAGLADTSVVFERLYANAPTTRLSVPALLSGTLPSRIDWQRQAAERGMRRVGPRTPWLPELLRAAGYTTIAVHASFRAFTAVENAGFDRGFDHYDVATPLLYRGGTMQGFPGEQQVDRSLGLVDQAGARPIFLWVHLLEPHYLYEQPPRAPHFGDGEGDLYDAEIAEADRQLGRLIDGLSARGLFEASILLVTGDHGEEFGEHGERWHTSNLYEPQVRTAGLMRVPGLPARRLRTPVALTDFAPTVLDLLRIEEPLARMHGRNLVRLLEHGDQPLPPLILENFQVDSGRGYQAAVVAWPHKLVYRQGAAFELYDVESDPGERDDLYAENHELAHMLANVLYPVRENAPRN